MKTKKSFVGLEPAYSFFQNHSTQQRKNVEAIVGALEGRLAKGGALTICDFGCGDGDFTVELLRHFRGKAKCNLSLVEPNLAYLEKAVSRIEAELQIAPQVLPSLADRTCQFDLIISHHVLYYVPNLAQALQTAAQSLAADGVLIAALAAKTNKISDCVRDLFAVKGRTIPYWLEEDLASGLSNARIEWRTETVESLLDCPDNPSARATLVRFLTGDLFADGMEDAALNVFEPYASEDRLRVPMTDRLFVCRMHSGRAGSLCDASLA